MKKILSIMMVALIVLSIFSILSPHTKAEPDDTPLDVAEKAAVWVMDEAIPEAAGYKWKFYTCHETLFYRRDVTYGAAGIGAFLLLLHEKTGNSTYLDYAKGAAQWVISQAVTSHDGYLWLSPDDDVPSGWRLSCDVAGIGEFFLKMYRVTGNSTYLDYAKGAAQWMMAMAEYEYGGCFIPYNPPGKYGSQASHGIGPGRESYTMSFLLHLYQETGNTTYLPYIKGMAQWLTAGLYCKAENGGYKWLWGYPYESVYGVTTAARVARYFYETYQALGNETYLHYANGGVQWILSQAVVDNDKVKWPSRQGASDYPVIAGDKLLHGIAVVSDILLMGYSVTGNTTYLEYAKKHTNWILSQAASEGDGYRFDNALRNAIIFSFLCDMFNAVKNVTYSQYADGAVIWIINNATTTDGGYKWRIVSYYPYCPTWFGQGAAGIGYYLARAPNPPVANFTWSPYIPKVGEPVTFNASVSTPNGGTITKHEWDFGDSENATGKIVTHNYTNLGTYTVTLNVTDSEGLWDIEQKQIQVVQPYGPKAEFTATPETTTVSESVKFDASASLSGWNGTHEMPITEYRWDFGDSNQTTTFTPVVYHSFSSSGIYYVTLTVYAPRATPETDATTHKVTITAVPVGGYSFQMKGYTTARPLTLYLAIVAILTTVFTTIKRKKHRRTKQS